jgi:hypothetical protein
VAATMTTTESATADRGIGLTGRWGPTARSTARTGGPPPTWEPGEAVRPSPSEG